MPNVLLVLGLITCLTGCTFMAVHGAATAVSIAHDRRTTGTIVEDQSIELKIYGEIDKNKDLMNNSHIDVTSYNNAVLLSGEVATPALRQQAEEIARGVEKVKYVHNELSIGPPTSIAERSSDGLITTKVKASLFQVSGIPGFDPSRVKVVTERGIVYLFGLLTHAEADAVTSTVRRVSGVQKVVKLFEYID